MQPFLCADCVSVHELLKPQLRYLPVQRFLFAAFVSMHEMRPQELANLAWALATMRVHPGA